MINELQEAIKNMEALANSDVLDSDKYNNLSSTTRKMKQIEMEIEPFINIGKAGRRLNRILKEDKDPRKFGQRNSPYHKIWFELLNEDIKIDNITAVGIIESCFHNDDGATLHTVIAQWVYSLKQKNIKPTTANNIGSIVAKRAYSLKYTPSAKKGSHIIIYADGSRQFKTPKSQK